MWNLNKLIEADTRIVVLQRIGGGKNGEMISKGYKISDRRNMFFTLALLHCVVNIASKKEY